MASGVGSRRVRTGVVAGRSRPFGGSFGAGVTVFNVLRGEQRLQRRSVWHPADLCVSTQERGRRSAQGWNAGTMQVLEGSKTVSHASFLIPRVWRRDEDGARGNRQDKWQRHIHQAQSRRAGRMREGREGFGCRIDADLVAPDGERKARTRDERSHNTVTPAKWSRRQWGQWGRGREEEKRESLSVVP